MKTLIVCLSAVLLVVPCPAQEKPNNDASSDEPTVEQLQEQATQSMKEQVGTWNCRWEFLDAEGNVSGQMEGTEVIEFEIPDRVLKVTTVVPEFDNRSVSLKFFKPDERLMYFVSVDKNGDLWTLTEEVGGEVAQSKRHANPNGDGDLYLRFTTLRKTKNEIDVLMESSTDQQNWTQVFRQFLVRETR